MPPFSATICSTSSGTFLGCCRLFEQMPHWNIFAFVFTTGIRCGGNNRWWSGFQIKSVWGFPGIRADCARSRMWEDHRCSGDCQGLQGYFDIYLPHLPHCVAGDMREIDQHPQPVHFTDHLWFVNQIAFSPAPSPSPQTRWAPRPLGGSRPPQPGQHQPRGCCTHGWGSCTVHPSCTGCAPVAGYFLSRGQTQHQSELGQTCVIVSEGWEQTKLAIFPSALASSMSATLVAQCKSSG